MDFETIALMQPGEDKVVVFDALVRWKTRGDQAVRFTLSGDFLGNEDRSTGPIEFLNALLREYTGAQPAGPVNKGRTEDASTWQEWGTFGTTGGELTWRATGDVIDGYAYTEWYRGSLPWIEFEWWAEYLKSGYGYRVTTQGLVVEFKEPAAEECFRRVWLSVFGHPVTFD